MRLRDLGSDRFGWEDLRAIVRNLPRSSALARALNPQAAEWTLGNELLAVVADRLTWLVWAKTKDGAKNRAIPKPIPRPSNNYNRRAQGRMAGALSLPVDEVKRRLALPRQPITPSPPIE